MQSNFFPGQGIVRAAKPLFAAVVELVETTAANNAAERRNPGKPGFLRSKKWPLTFSLNSYFFQFVIFTADSQVFLKLFHKIAECLSIM